MLFIPCSKIISPGLTPEVQKVEISIDLRMKSHCGKCSSALGEIVESEIFTFTFNGQKSEIAIIKKKDREKRKEIDVKVKCSEKLPSQLCCCSFIIFLNN